MTEQLKDDAAQIATMPHSTIPVKMADKAFVAISREDVRRLARAFDLRQQANLP